ncbi:MAG: hypothetical protein F2681_14900 [Actinobacteria bacterium]|uniref:Unannotated protein n=1 Tax=freshwater metagenome TaxID=449393 RepID=A0A6J6T6V5_9ZZZZ|nr:hypothetical protein [Actinomycetota bacterium]MSW79059.1 hypothetical protein [Actinomycetota bacterium]MSX54301.1 hypothetical protein [Actinomycetota bacterium]MSX92111.1 hypothetical protein [Actinomycetota bacterium]MSZ84423.1 hypothetical protein [Actinomycetota bacterium]
MNRRQERAARVLTAVGLASSVAYVVWRFATTLSGTRLWFSVPVLGLECVGFAGAGLLAWALWPSLRRDSVPALPCSMDVVVRVDDQVLHEVRATLVALRSVRSVAGVIVVDLATRPEIAGLATEFGAKYAATATNDRNGLAVMASMVTTSEFALLDGGDIPTRDFVERLAAHMADSRVAAVQGMGTSFAGDSAEHGPDHHHELGFEREALNPALGRRGCAVWTGSGSVARTEPVRSGAPEHGSALEAHWHVTAEMLTAGWKIVAPSGSPVVAHRAVQSETIVFLDRAERARAARWLLTSPGGVLRASTLTLRQRLAMLAWCVRPLSALRRTMFVVVVVCSLLAGVVPFHASGLALVLTAVPAYLYTSFGLSLLSDWKLRPGDRSRWSLHSLGPVWASLRSRAHALSPDAQYGGGLTFAVVALSGVLVIRGVSDRWTHSLGGLPQPALMGLMLACLWTLALSLDVLRVLARRTQQRRTARVVSALSAVLDDRGVSVVDLTPLGAGLTNHHTVEVGARMMLESSVPTATGVTDIHVDCVVRNTRPTEDGGWRIGVEFTGMNAAASNALVEFCSIEPIWERLGVLTGRVADDSRHVIYVDEAMSAPMGSGRLAVRVIALLALVGAVASTASTANASPALAHMIRGVVMSIDGTDTATADSANTAVVVGVCSLDPGADGVWGTSDDTYSDPVAVQSAADGSYELALAGQACWAEAVPPAGYQSTAPADVTTGLQPLDVSGAPILRTSFVQRDGVVAHNASSGTTEQVTTPAAAVAEVRSIVTALSADGPGARTPLPTPRVDQLAAEHESRSTLSVLVLMLAGLMAASILLGSARPRTAAAR